MVGQRCRVVRASFVLAALLSERPPYESDLAAQTSQSNHGLADDGSESLDTMLTRMFEELTDLNKERLSRLIPGLSEAIGWPERERRPRP